MRSISFSETIRRKMSPIYILICHSALIPYVSRDVHVHRLKPPKKVNIVSPRHYGSLKEKLIVNNF